MCVGGCSIGLMPSTPPPKQVRLHKMVAYIRIESIMSNQLLVLLTWECTMMLGFLGEVAFLARSVAVCC